MVYKEFQDKKLSALGFGAMRLPVSDSIPGTPIDEEKTEEMVDFALRHGVNYFDTAYGYHDGTSEVVMEKYSVSTEGQLLSGYKISGYDLSNMDKVDTIFEEQLANAAWNISTSICSIIYMRRISIRIWIRSTNHGLSVKAKGERTHQASRIFRSWTV